MRCCDHIEICTGKIRDTVFRLRSVSHPWHMITKNIGMLTLAIYLILVGITSLFHVAIGAIVMGVVALIAGILILIGK